MPHSAAPPDPAAKRIFIHVGAPKTGTTFLQSVLFDNRRKLARAGVLYPYRTADEPFRSTLDFCGTGWGGAPARRYRGAWAPVAHRCREWTGHTAILSNELLAGASRERIEQGVRSLTIDTDRPAEVHVVFTARDFARQLVSDWQEHVKHKNHVTLQEFVGALVELGLDAPEPFATMFWDYHDAARVLRRWSAVVPPERIHLVTLPQAGGPRDALWTRFCAVTGLVPGAYRARRPRTNTSMGVAETEFLRRINPDLKTVDEPHYDILVRAHLGEEVLGNRSAKLTLPPEWMPPVVERSRRLVAELEAASYDVVGDLAELLPVPDDHAPHVAPEDVSDAELLDVATRATTAMIRRGEHLRRRVIALDPDAPAPARPTLARRVLRRARMLAQPLRDRQK